MNGPVLLSVSQLTAYVKSKFDGDPALAAVFVTGEISNFTNHYKSGHFYLSLKDGRAVIKCVMFAQFARRLRFSPGDGMKVIVRGRVSVYEATGQYQLYIEDMQPDGLGALNLAFEQLKEKLSKEGLFDPARKRPLPRFPESVGVITSPTGAAVHDMITVLERRWPMARVVFCPVLVQGEGAAPQLVDALKRMNRLQCADVILLGRGGGSLEDLWAFNEEAVARAVADSRIPVVSAVGHETDFTICDFAADLRAPTPSAAAELAVPDGAEWLASVSFCGVRLKQAVRKSVEEKRRETDRLARRPVLLAPQELVERRRMQVDLLASRLNGRARAELQQAKNNLGGLSGRLQALSPLAVLARGYALLSSGETPLTSAKQARPGQKIDVLLTGGILGCTVDTVKEEKRGNPIE